MVGVPPALLVPLTVVVGDEDLLVGAGGLARSSAAARRARPRRRRARPRRRASSQRGDLPDVLSPSLFGERRVLVVRAAQDLAKDVAAELAAYLADPLDDVHARRRARRRRQGQGAARPRCSRAEPRRVDAPKVTKPGSGATSCARELKADGRVVDEEAVAALLEAVGNDLRELASAAGQLLADTDGPITAEAVARYHRGRAEASAASPSPTGPSTATSPARWSSPAGAQSTGLAPVLVTSALASTLRSMALVARAGRVPAHQLAGQLGMPPWKVEKTQRQARGWRPEGLSAALPAVARADADVKGGGRRPGLRRRAGAPRRRAGPRGGPVTAQTASGRHEHDGRGAVGTPRPPLYPRLLRLRHLHPNAWQRALLGEGSLRAGGAAGARRPRRRPGRCSCCRWRSPPSSRPTTSLAGLLAGPTGTRERRRSREDRRRRSDGGD